MEKWWLLKDQAGVLRQVVTDGRTPAEAGEDMSNRTAHPMVRRGDFALEIPDLHQGAWGENLSAVKTQLLDQIDERREIEQMKYLTAGGAKKMIYTQKAKEVETYRSFTTGLLATLSLEDRRTRFPAAMAEADLTGATLASIISKYEQGAKTSNGKVMKLEAIAQRAKEQIKAATSATAARGAAQVNWVV